MHEAEEKFKGVCQGMKVLVVDDLLPNRELIKEYFEVLGCTGDYARNGQEAVDMVRKNQYDVCLMDFQMPVMDGIEATKIIRQELKSEVVIIALTGVATIDELRDEQLLCQAYQHERPRYGDACLQKAGIRSDQIIFVPRRSSCCAGCPRWRAVPDWVGWWPWIDWTSKSLACFGRVFAERWDGLD